MITEEALAGEPRVFGLAGRKSREIPLAWRRARYEGEPVPDHAIEVAPGVRVRLLGFGDLLLPEGGEPGEPATIRTTGAEIAVWVTRHHHDPEANCDCGPDYPPGTTTRCEYAMLSDCVIEA